MFRSKQDEDEIERYNSILTFVVICIELMGLLVLAWAVGEFFTFDLVNWRK